MVVGQGRDDGDDNVAAAVLGHRPQRPGENRRVAPRGDVVGVRHRPRRADRLADCPPGVVIEGGETQVRGRGDGVGGDDAGTAGRRDDADPQHRGRVPRRQNGKHRHGVAEFLQRVNEADAGVPQGRPADSGVPDDSAGVAEGRQAPTGRRAAAEGDDRLACADDGLLEGGQVVGVGDALEKHSDGRAGPVVEEGGGDLDGAQVDLVAGADEVGEAGAAPGEGLQHGDADPARLHDQTDAAGSGGLGQRGVGRAEHDTGHRAQHAGAVRPDEAEPWDVAQERTEVGPARLADAGLEARGEGDGVAETGLGARLQRRQHGVGRGGDESDVALARGGHG